MLTSTYKVIFKSFTPTNDINHTCTCSKLRHQLHLTLHCCAGVNSHISEIVENKWHWCLGSYNMKPFEVDTLGIPYLPDLTNSSGSEETLQSSAGHEILELESSSAKQQLVLCLHSLIEIHGATCCPKELDSKSFLGGSA